MQRTCQVELVNVQPTDRLHVCCFHSKILTFKDRFLLLVKNCAVDFCLIVNFFLNNIIETNKTKKSKGSVSTKPTQNTIFQNVVSIYHFS